MTLNDSHGRFGNCRLRRALARALAAMLCLAVVTAGVLHNTVAHADDHGRSEIAFTVVADLGGQSGGTSADQNGADPCSVGANCLFWSILPGAADWRLLSGEALEASNDTFHGITTPVHRRPPRSSLIV